MERIGLWQTFRCETEGRKAERPCTVRFPVFFLNADVQEVHFVSELHLESKCDLLFMNVTGLTILLVITASVHSPSVEYKRFESIFYFVSSL